MHDVYGHSMGLNHYTVVTPNRLVLLFCDSDCLRRYFEAEHEREILEMRLAREEMKRARA